MGGAYRIELADYLEDEYGNEVAVELNHDDCVFTASRNGDLAAIIRHAMRLGMAIGVASVTLPLIGPVGEARPL